MEGGAMYYALPDDVLREIFMRLPARLLCRVRVVCKAWCALTSEASFLRAHANHVAASPVVLRWSVSRVQGSDNILHLSFPRGHAAGGDDARFRRCCDLRLFLTDQYSCPATAMNSWDGVLCVETSVRVPPPQFVEHTPSSYFLLNPLSRASTVVSAPVVRSGQRRYDRGQIIGAYCHPISGIFHLLHCAMTYSSSSAGVGRGGGGTPCFRVLRVDAPDAAWRDIPTSADDDACTAWLQAAVGRLSLQSQATVHGNLHWPWRGLPLLVFDTAREEFGTLALPPLRGARSNTQQQTIGTLSGKLCLLAGVGRAALSRAQLWVLEDYRARDWRLRLVIHADNSPLNLDVPTNCLDNVGILVGSDGEVQEIVLYTWDKMFSIARDGWGGSWPSSWSRTELGYRVGLAIHKESLLPHHLVFGTAPPSHGVVISGNCPDNAVAGVHR